MCGSVLGRDSRSTGGGLHRFGRGRTLLGQVAQSLDGIAGSRRIRAGLVALLLGYGGREGSVLYFWSLKSAT